MPKPFASTDPESHAVPRPTVVVVDDDPNLVECLQALLEAQGYVVEGFTDPEVALARLRGGPAPDVALVDCVMPRMTGAELAEALAQSGVGVPVVLMTALADPSFAVHLDTISVVHKPFVIEDLIAEIESRVHPAPSSGPRASAPAPVRGA
jgi:CheY-like chemotaxis protein